MKKITINNVLIFPILAIIAIFQSGCFNVDSKKSMSFFDSTEPVIPVNNNANSNSSNSERAPNTPSSLIANTISPTQINLSWSDNSTNETGFEIQYSSKPDFSSNNFIVTTNPGVNTKSIANLQDATTYYFRIRAVNGTLTSSYSNPVSKATVLSPPTSLSAVAISSTQINVSWTDNTNLESGFLIQYSKDSTFLDNVQTKTVAANTTTAQLTQLAADTTYFIRVQSTHTSLPASAFTSVINTKTTALAPNAPTAISAISTSSSSIDFKWADVLNETSYTIDYSTASNFPVTSPVTTWTISAIAANSTTKSIVGLNAATTYFIRIKAINSMGSSLYSTTLSTTTQVPVKVNPVTSIVLTNPNTNPGKLTKPTFLISGNIISGNTVNLYQKNGTTNCGTLVGSATSTTTNISITSSNALTVSGQYEFYATVQNSNGTSACSTAFGNYTLDITPPNPPSSVTLNTPISSPSNLTSPVIQVGGVTAGDTIEIYANSTTCAATDKKGSAIVANNATTVNITSSILTQGTYSFTAKSTDPLGNVSSCSSVKSSNLIIDTTSPTVAVTSPTSNQILSGTSVTLSSTASDTGGAILQKVEFYVGSTLVGTDTTSPYSVVFNSTTLADGNVIVLAKAYDTAGNVTSSTNVNATIRNSIIPNAPSNLAAKTASSNSINLTWTDNSTNETGFLIETSISNAFTNTTNTTSTSNTTSATISGLTAGTTYYFRIRSNISNTYSTYSNTANATTSGGSTGGWTLPTTPIPTTSGFYPLLSGMDTQTQEAYRVLYHWLAHFNATDYDVPKSNITYDANFFTNSENVFKFRALTSNVGRNLTNDAVKIIQLSSNAFVLSTIDNGGQLKIQRNASYLLADPIGGAWFYLWDYPGNPHYQRASLIHRSFAYAIPAMVWLDNQHHKGLNQRSDFIGGSLNRYAITYSAGKALLPTVVQQAYEYILIKMFNRANTWNLVNIFGDMEIQTAVGMYYTAKALGISSYYTTAANRAQFIFNTVINQAGFEKHENGADLVYNGIAQYFMAWLLSATQADAQASSLYSWLIPYMDRACKYINYLTYLDPVDSSFGAVKNPLNPSHYHAANGGGLGSSIWNTGYKSYFVGGMYSNQCKTFLHNQLGETYIQYPLTDSVATMKSTIQSFLSTDNFINMTSTDCNGDGGQGRWSVKCNSTDMPVSPVAENHWTSDTTFQYQYLYYKPNYYSELMSDVSNNAQWNKFPSKFTTNFIEQLQDTAATEANKKAWFVIGKSSTLHTIWHLGSLAWRNSATNVAGFGGGAISSIATTAGPIIMGAERGNQDNAFQISEWRNWPTHHIAGLDSSGKYFGNARDRDLSRTVTQNGNTNISATITGKIGITDNPLTNPSGNIKGNVTYTRTLGFDQSSGVSVTSRINSNGSDQVSELYEIIPVYLYNSGFNNCTSRPSECSVISFKSNGTWVAASTSYSTNVSAVRITRLNTSLYVNFSTLQSVKLNPATIPLTREPQFYRTIMIDLLNNGGSITNLPTNKEISYTISTTAP